MEADNRKGGCVMEAGMIEQPWTGEGSPRLEDEPEDPAALRRRCNDYPCRCLRDEMEAEEEVMDCPF